MPCAGKQAGRAVSRPPRQCAMVIRSTALGAMLPRNIDCQRAFRRVYIHRQFIWAAIIQAAWVVGDPQWNLAMKPLLIVLTAAVVLAMGSTLAVMNNACKSGKHAWCASRIPQLRTARRLAPCSGQAALSPVRPIELLAGRLSRAPDSDSRSLVFAFPAGNGR